MISSRSLSTDFRWESFDEAIAFSPAVKRDVATYYRLSNKTEPIRLRMSETMRALTATAVPIWLLDVAPITNTMNDTAAMTNSKVTLNFPLPYSPLGLIHAGNWGLVNYSSIWKRCQWQEEPRTPSNKFDWTTARRLVRSWAINPNLKSAYSATFVQSWSLADG